MRKDSRATPIAFLSAFVVLLSASFVLAGVKHSTVSENWIGASIQTVDSDLSEAFELPVSYGVIINRVVEGAPAYKAGIMQDDIVIAFNGNRVTDEDMLRELIEETDEGDNVTLTIMRGDEKKEIDLVIESRDNDDSIGRYRNWQKGPRGGFFRGPSSFDRGRFFYHDQERPYLGILMSDLTEQLGDYFGVGNGDGALITEIIEDSPAEQAGLKAGDVIVSIDDERIRNTGDVSEFISDREVDEEIEIAILRDKRNVTVKAVVGESNDPLFGSQLGFGDYAPGLYGLNALRNLRDIPFDDIDRHEIRPYGDYRSDMKKLQKELRDLRKEMKELRDSKR